MQCLNDYSYLRIFLCQVDWFSTWEKAEGLILLSNNSGLTSVKLVIEILTPFLHIPMPHLKSTTCCTCTHKTYHNFLNQHWTSQLDVLNSSSHFGTYQNSAPPFAEYIVISRLQKRNTSIHPIL